jgi:hypothetical protein
MGKLKKLKLILYENGKEVKTILKHNSETSIEQIMDTAEKWRKKDIKKNSIKFSIE